MTVQPKKRGVGSGITGSLFLRAMHGRFAVADFSSSSKCGGAHHSHRAEIAIRRWWVLVWAWSSFSEIFCVCLRWGCREH